MHTRTLRSIGIGLLCSTTVTAASIVFAASVSDINNSRHKDAIQYLIDTGIVSGYKDGTFRPNATINRAEFVKVLTKMTGTEPANDTYHLCFPDVHDEWFAPFICYAKKQKWIGGYPDEQFKPSTTVSTVEAIKMLITAGNCTSMQSAVSSSFTDVLPGTWYAPYVQAASNAGLLQWVPGKVLGVNTGLTRGQMSEMVYRCMIGKKSAASSSSLSFRIDAAGANSSLWQKIVTAMHRGGGQGGGSTTVISGGGTTGGGGASLSAPHITFGDLAKNYGDASFALSPTSDSSGTFTYDSSNTGVATLVGNMVTIIGAGTSTITATQAANGNYTSGVKVMTLTVSAIAPTIGTFTNVTKQIGDIPFALTAPTSNSAGAFTYMSGNTGIATISGDTVTLVAPGTTTITATQAANGNYTSGVKVMTTFRVVAGQCELEEPCLYGGSCTNGPHGTFSCECIDGHSGPMCDLDASNCDPDGPNACLNGGTCTPTSAHGECSCAPCFGGARCDEYQCA